jgi:hypothetical protein
MAYGKAINSKQFSVHTIMAARDFLRADHAKDLNGLHKIKVNGELLTRGEVADLLDLEITKLGGEVGSEPSK